MLDKITVFDVETADSHQSRICAIGIVVIENGKAVKSVSHLVNPQCRFDKWNVAVHGITEVTVAEEKTFSQLWPEISGYFTDTVLCGHNVGFDIRVLEKTCAAYGLDFQKPHYIDTMPLIPFFWPDSPDRKLNTICNLLGIPLDHHDAGSDANATAEILLRMLVMGLDESALREYTTPEPSRRQSSTRKSRTTRHIQELRELLSGITMDGKIQPEEYRTLCSWLCWRSDLTGMYPYDDLVAAVYRFDYDEATDPDAFAELEQLCVSLLDPVNSFACGNNDICVKDKLVVLTGEFECGSRFEVERQLAERGATVQKSVTQKTDFLLIGSVGSPDWSSGNYGNKVKRAMELQAKGFGIQIIREADFF